MVFCLSDLTPINERTVMPKYSDSDQINQYGSVLIVSNGKYNIWVLIPPPSRISTFCRCWKGNGWFIKTRASEWGAYQKILSSPNPNAIKPIIKSLVFNRKKCIFNLHKAFYSLGNHILDYAELVFVSSFAIQHGYIDQSLF